MGMALGYSHFKGRAALAWALILTVVVIPWQTAHVVGGQATIQGVLTQEWVRLWATFQHIAAREPVDDPIFFVTLVSSLYWWIGLHCGYRLVRGGNLLTILLPPTLSILIVQYYDGNDPARIWILAVYFLLLLLLVGRVNSLRSREKWESIRVFSGADSEFDLARSVFLMAAAVIFAAWVFPAPGVAIPTAARLWQRLTEPYETLIQWVDQALDAVRGDSGNGLQAYGNTLGLGVRANQGVQTVFRVVAPNVDFPRYYWQMRIYDTYEDGKWSNSHQNWSRGFSPENGDLPIPRSRVGQNALFGFFWEGDASTLLAVPSQPLWVNLGGTIQYEDAGSGQIELTSWHTDPYLQKGAEYTARAQLLAPSITALRNAGAKYPQWVMERSLQTPNSLPDDVRVLAQDLTANQPTVYDKAAAVTDYLRREIKYSPNIAPPPPGVDTLDWFLFTWKSGYCNYYATAEIMLLRSVGIPARMAVGYAQGEHGSDGSFTVRGRDSHAWPQVYFPGIGWVDFEPTAGQPTIVRPVESIGEEPYQPSGDEQAVVLPPEVLRDAQNSQNQNNAIPYQTIGVWVIILVIISTIGYGIWSLDRKKAIGRRIPQFVRAFYERYGLTVPGWLEKWERWANVSSIERSFHAINQSLAWLGHAQPQHATPAERGEQLKSLLPALSNEIERLTKEHENTLFGPTPGDPSKASRAAWAIRWQAAWAALQRLFGV